MMKHAQQAEHVSALAARLGVANVINDHPPDHGAAFGILRQVTANAASARFWYVLVLGDGQDFSWLKPAERDHVLKADQGWP